jgi:hypothetical protein
VGESGQVARGSRPLSRGLTDRRRKDGNMATRKQIESAVAPVYIEHPFGWCFTLERHGYCLGVQREPAGEDPRTGKPVDRVIVIPQPGHDHHADGIVPRGELPAGLIDKDPLHAQDRELLQQIGTVLNKKPFDLDVTALREYLCDECGIVKSRLRRLRWSEIVAEIRRHRGGAALTQSEQPEPPQQAQPENGDEWSRPVAKSYIATVLNLSGSYKVTSLADAGVYKLREAGNRQSWQICLSGLPEEARKKLI